MNIAIDIDGVLANFTTAYTKVAVELGLLAAPISPYDQSTWRFDFPADPVWREIDQRWNWWKTLEPIVANYEVSIINMLISFNNVYFLTNRRSGKVGLSAKTQSEYWLGGVGIDITHAQVITCEGKGAVAAALGVTLAIDDKPENVVDIHTKGIDCVVRGWLYNIGTPGPVVYNIEEFYNYIEEHYEQ